MKIGLLSKILQIFGTRVDIIEVILLIVDKLLWFLQIRTHKVTIYKDKHYIKIKTKYLNVTRRIANNSDGFLIKRTFSDFKIFLLEGKDVIGIYTVTQNREITYEKKEKSIED